MINKKYRLYVFDLDGTLADTKVDLRRAFSEALTAHGFKAPSLEETYASVGNGALKSIQRLTGLDEAEAIPLEETFKKTYEYICCDNVKLYAGARELLLRLKEKGSVLALVTMKSKTPTHKILHFLGIDFFSEVITFEDAKKRKPEPDTLLEMLRKYKLKPANALMTGDSVTDIEYANAAGVDACILKHGYGDLGQIESKKPEYLLNGFNEF